MTHQTVQRCLDRAVRFGVMAALDDSPRPGKEPTITDTARPWVVSLACQKPKEVGAEVNQRGLMTSSKSGRPAVIRNVQVLRAVAAILVVFVHLHGLLSWLGLPPFGYGGVDIFFVISGFIMVYTTMGRAATPWSFITDRIARIVPSYWAVTLAVFAVALIAPAFLQATRPDWGELVKSLLFIPFTKSNGLVEPTLFVGWTLNYEMFFYLLFAAGLAFPNKKVGAGSVIFCLACLVAIGLLGQPEGVIGKFYTSTIMLDFARGMIIGLTCRQLPAHAAVVLKLTAALFVFLGLGATVFLPILFPNVPPFFVRGLPASVVVGSAIALEHWEWSMRRRWLLSLGNASYSIYLVHPFVTQIAQKIATPMIRLNISADLFLVAAALMGVCVIGVMLYHILERSLTNWLRRSLKVRRLNPNTA